MRSIDLSAAENAREKAEAERKQRHECCFDAHKDSAEKTGVLAVISRGAGNLVGFEQGERVVRHGVSARRIGNLYRRHSDNLLSSTPDLERKIHIRPALAVFLVKIIEAANKVLARHRSIERSALDRHGLGRIIDGLHFQLRTRCRQTEELTVMSQGANSDRIRVCIDAGGKPADGVGLNLGLRDEEEDQVSGSRTHADIQRFGISKIARQAQRGYAWKFNIYLRATVARSFIHDDNFETLTILGGLERGETAPQSFDIVIRDNQGRNPGLRFCFLLGNIVHAIKMITHRAFGLLLIAASTACAQQYRAFWVDAFHYGFKTPSQVDQTIEDMAAAKCNAIFAEVRSRGNSYYVNSVEPPAEDPDYAPGFDALQYLIDRAHAMGIEVHAWFPITPLWTNAKPPVNPEHLWYKHGPAVAGDDMWMTVDSTGKTGTSLDPGHPGAFEYLADLVVNVAANYDLDGVHLDYIRYPETASFGYNPFAIRRFQRLYGRAGVPAGSDAQFSEFRRAQVTALVRQIYLRIFAVKPRVKVSAAVITWGNGPLSDDEFRTKDAYSRVFQDWRGWLEEGILDLAVPMNYFREQQFPAYLNRWMEYEKDRQYGRMTSIGIAPYLNSIADSLAQAARAMAPSAAGNTASGIFFYSYASTNTLDSRGVPMVPNSEFFNALGNTFATPADTPDLPWRTHPARGHVYGWVRIEDGAPERHDGLALTIESDTGNDISREIFTDSTGFFGAVDLPPDRYRVRLLKDGQEIFRSVPQNVDAGSAAMFEIFLHDSDIP